MLGIPEKMRQNSAFIADLRELLEESGQTGSSDIVWPRRDGAADSPLR